MRHEIELNCDCPRCGKSLYHTVAWLRQNPSLTCAGCGSVMPSIGILEDNTRKVRESDDAERAASGPA